MKRKSLMNRLIMAAMLMLSAFAAAVQAQQKVFNDNQNKTNMESNTIRLTIEGGRTFTATLVDNSSTQALKEQLAKGNITVETRLFHLKQVLPFKNNVIL